MPWNNGIPRSFKIEVSSTSSASCWFNKPCVDITVQFYNASGGRTYHSDSREIILSYVYKPLLIKRIFGITWKVKVMWAIKSLRRKARNVLSIYELEKQRIKESQEFIDSLTLNSDDVVLRKSK